MPSKADTRVSGTVGIVRLFGIPIRFHFTFVLLLIFLLFAGIGEPQSGALNALFVLALFLSVVLHEMGHALVARRYGIGTLEIVLFPIGGVARLERQPRAREELWIAIAGPLVNLVLAGSLLVWLQLTGASLSFAELQNPSGPNLPPRIAAGNLLLAGFNLLPAYPMDGGRIFRALLALSRPADQATEMAARAGRMFAGGIGLYGLLSANFLLVFIALFVYLGALQEGVAAKGRSLTAGFKVRDAMITDYRTLAHGNTIRDAGTLLLSTSQHDFPVMYGETVMGLLGRAGLVRAMLTAGAESYVASAMDREFLRVPADFDLSEAFSLMASARSCALVMEGDRLMGLLTAENLSEFLMLRQVNLVEAKSGRR